MWTRDSRHPGPPSDLRSVQLLEFPVNSVHLRRKNTRFFHSDRRSLTARSLTERNEFTTSFVAAGLKCSPGS